MKKIKLTTSSPEDFNDCISNIHSRLKPFSAIEYDLSVAKKILLELEIENKEETEEGGTIPPETTLKIKPKPPML